MPDNPNLHWTEDDDLLTQYVLGRLSEEDQRQLEAHLRSCSRCREAVRQEQEMVAGVRQYGREELKMRLKNRLALHAGSRATRITWQRALSAAAVVVMVAGIGIYNHWFDWGANKSVSTADQTQKLRDTLTAHERKAMQREEKKPVIDENNVGPNVASRDESLQKVETGQGQQTQSFALAHKVPTGRNEPTKKLEDLVSAPHAGGMVSVNKEQGSMGNRMVIAQPGITRFWVEGEILRDGETLPSERASLGQGGAGEKEMMMAARPKTKTGQGQNSAETYQENGISIQQLQINLLPPERRKQHQERSNAIQAYVQLSNRGTSLTMYLDTLFDEQDVRKAQMEEIRPDSLVVQIGSRQVGFKLPTAIQTPLQGAKEGEQK